MEIKGKTLLSGKAIKSLSDDRLDKISGGLAHGGGCCCNVCGVQVSIHASFCPCCGRERQ